MSLSNAERQRNYQSRKKSERLTMQYIPCACGCGELIPAINSMGKPAKFKLGHNAKIIDTGGRFQKDQEAWNKGKPLSSETKSKLSLKLKGRTSPYKGKKSSHETRLKISMSHKGLPSSNKGIPLPPETKAKISQTLKGRKLSQETLAKISGENHHGWKGGASTLPYGIGFTRRFKRLIRERDGNRCQRCGKTREQNWRALEVHHIDHDKMNNDPTNLVTVCGSCNVWLSHNREDSLVIFPKRKMLL